MKSLPKKKLQQLLESIVDAMNDLKRIVTHTARIAYAVLGKVQELVDETGEETDGDGDGED